MSCSNPIRLYEKDLKPSLRKNHSDFTKNALTRSLNEFDYMEVPCRYCLNCRIDRQNEMVDKAEYEYIKYGCGAFVTFTYDDIHLFKNSFIDSKTGKTVASINKKDGKDFLNRLNKLVHAENKKTGFNPLCRKDYRYVITHEYGDSFNRPHFHALFFGLDFAYCERLFWRAWQGQGSIQVGSIKNGGIAYAVKYISSQSYGIDSFFKYDYHHLTRPSSSHSLHFGEDLYKSQLKFIKEHDGNYLWHNKLRPVPSYYKNKYNIVSDLDAKKYEKKFQLKCDNINNLYGIRPKTFRELHDISLNIANIRQRNREIKLQQSGKQVYKPEYINAELHNFRYSNNRLHNQFDSKLSRIINPDGTSIIKINNRYTDKLTTRDLMRLGTDRNHLIRQYGITLTDKMLGLETVPF